MRTGRCDILRNVGRFPEAPVVLVGLLLVCAGPAPRAFGGALDDLCSSAGYGPGCVSATRAPPPPPPSSWTRTPSTRPVPAARPPATPAFDPNRMMSGVFTSILTNLVVNAVFSADTGPSAQEQAAAAERAEALRRAVEEQERIQAERDRQMLGSLLDTSATGLLGDPAGLPLLEDAAAAAGRPFDGSGGAAGQWGAHQDAWFSTRDPGPGSPLPLSDAPLEIRPDDWAPLRCGSSLSGEPCALAGDTPPRATIDPLTVQQLPAPAPAPAFQGARPGTPSVVETTTWRDTVVAGVRQVVPGLGSPGEGESLPVSILSTVATKMGDRALPSLQGAVASEGRNAYEAFLGATMGRVFDVLNDAQAGHWQSAVEKSDPSRIAADVTRAGVEATTVGKIAWPALTGRPDSALRELGALGQGAAGDATRELFTEWSLDQAKDAARKAGHWLVQPRGPKFL